MHKYSRRQGLKPNGMAVLQLGIASSEHQEFVQRLNPFNSADILGCLSKLLDVKAQIERLAKRDNTPPIEANLP